MHQKASVVSAALYSEQRLVDTRDTRRDMVFLELWAALLLGTSWGTRCLTIGMEVAMAVIRAMADTTGSTTVIIRIMGAIGVEAAGVVAGTRKVKLMGQL